MIRMDDRDLEALSAPIPRPWFRSHDRRTALARLIATLVQHVQSGRESPTLRARFEAGVREALRVPAVRLREGPPPYVTTAPAQADGSRRKCIDVPTRAGTPRMVLEALRRFRDRPGPVGQPVVPRWPRNWPRWSSHSSNRATSAPRPAGVVRRPDGTVPPLVGTSPAMMTLRQNIDRVAATDFTVLIQGESGTGKELVARQLHRLSRRRHGAVRGGQLRRARGIAARGGAVRHRGPHRHRRAGPQGQVRARRRRHAVPRRGLRPDAVGAGEAAARDPGTGGRAGGRPHQPQGRYAHRGGDQPEPPRAGAAGQFREDLYYRLSGVELHVPPLRARRQDIPDLCAHFMSRYQTPRPLSLTAEAAEAMQVYDWPGNVRELERLIEGAVTLASGDRITIGDLPEALRTECAEAHPRVARPQRHDEGVGRALRAARARPLRAEQAEGVPASSTSATTRSCRTCSGNPTSRPNQPPPEVHDADGESEDDVRFDAEASAPGAAMTAPRGESSADEPGASPPRRVRWGSGWGGVE